MIEHKSLGRGSQTRGPVGRMSPTILFYATLTPILVLITGCGPAAHGEKYFWLLATKARTDLLCPYCNMQHAVAK